VEDPILFHNIDLRTDRAYFLYIGEIKAHGLNAFLIPTLEKIYGRPVECIALVPDVLSRYSSPNLAVLNKESHRYYCKDNLLVNCRPNPGQYAREVSASRMAQELVENILRDQDFVYIHMFESRPEMTLTVDDRIRLLGPKPDLARMFNSKVFQYQMACELGITVPEGVCCECLEQALDAAQSFFRSGEEVFISEQYSAAGSNSAFVYSCEQILERFRVRNQPYLVTRRIQHNHDPTVLAVVANGEDVYAASVADQRMEENRFLGSTFPTVLEGEVVEQIKDCTRKVGRYMGARGYRGMFGCDFLIADNGKPYFVEVNARKQGTTLESTLTMLHRLPGHPSLLEIEFSAITRGKLPEGLTEMVCTESDLCWGTSNVKSEQDILVDRDIAEPENEPEIFRRVFVDKGAAAQGIVEDHLGAGVYQRAGGFVGRCISVGKTLNSVTEMLQQKEQEVKASMYPWHR